MQHSATVLSSLPLQISLFHHFYYNLAFFVLGASLLIYKAFHPDYTHDYPAPARAWEAIILVFWFIIENTRLYSCSNGNRTEESSPVFISLILTSPIVFAHLYNLLWQKFIFQVEEVTNVLSLIFIFFETLLAAQLACRLKTTKRIL